MSSDIRQFLDIIQCSVSEPRDIEGAKKNVLAALTRGADTTEIVAAMSRGLEDVGEKYERGVYFLSELIMAGIVAAEITNILKPHLGTSEKIGAGKVVIGTVKGDLHDIGKNIVIAMLSSTGFTIMDLGIDVTAESFLEAVKREKPDIVAMSCLLTIAMDEMRRTIEKLNEAGLRRKVKVMVGGRPITPEFAKEIGADAYGKDAIEAIRIAKSLAKERSK